jgi:DNA-binding PadR family transcriptional regulator
MYRGDQDTGGPQRRHKHHGRAAMSGRHGHGHGPGPGGWGRDFGAMRGWGGGRRRRMHRGDVRAALLVLLEDGPQTGYGLMEEIERRSEGAWRPSPGSVYPTLKQLEDEELVQAEAGQGRTPFTLTDAGKAYVEENREQLGQPWARPDEGVGEGRLELRGLLSQIAAATYQLSVAADEAQVARAKELLGETRRGLYRILADDDPADQPES